MEQSPDLRDKRPPIVLIVDDNPGIRNVVSWSLQLGGYEPVEAANGWEAVRWIEQARQQARYPSVILLDLAMPDMNGEGFLHWLKNQWPPHDPMPSIIIVTAGYADESMFSLAVQQVVIKPFHLRDLLEIVRKWAA